MERDMSMADRDGKIWMDGRLVDWRDARIHVLSHTLHYGCGAFEGVRAYNAIGGTAIFRLQEHTERLFNSAKILRMKIPFTPDQVMAAQCEVVRANGLESCYIRPLTWIGCEKLGVSPKGNTIHLMVAAWARPRVSRSRSRSVAGCNNCRGRWHARLRAVRPSPGRA